MPFTSTYSTVLSPFVQNYREASNDTRRKTVLNNAIDAVKKSKALLEVAEDLPKDLAAVSVLFFGCHFHIYLWMRLQAIRRYLKTSMAKDLEGEVVAEPETKVRRKPKKVKSIYTIRDVIKYHYRDLIDGKIPYQPGEPEYLAKFQATATSVLKNLNEEDLEEAENILDKWNKDGAPSEIQLK
jgi:hypothetical protein